MKQNSSTQFIDYDLIDFSETRNNLFINYKKYHHSKKWLNNFRIYEFGIPMALGVVSLFSPFLFLFFDSSKDLKHFAITPLAYKFHLHHGVHYTHQDIMNIRIDTKF